MWTAQSHSRLFLNSARIFYFVDGQSIAARLAKQVNRVTKQVKKDIEKFNNDEHGSVQSLPSNITFDGIKDPDCEFWLTLQPESRQQEIPTVPLNVKRKAIDLCHLLDRSKEEQVLLKDEMKNTFSHFFHQHELISDFLVALSQDTEIVDDRQYGAQLFARKKLLDIEFTLLKLSKVFSGHIDVEMPQTYILTETTALNTVDVELAFEDDEEEQIVVMSSVVESDNESNYDSEYVSDDDFITYEA